MLEKSNMIAAARWRMMHQKVLNWILGCLYRYSALCILGRDDVSTYVSLIARPAGSLTILGFSASDTHRKEERSSHICGASRAQPSILQGKKLEAHIVLFN